MYPQRGSGGLLGAVPKQEEMKSGRGTGGWRGWGTVGRGECDGGVAVSTGMTERCRVRSSRAGSQFRGLPSGCTVNLATMFLLLSWAVGWGVGMPRGPPPPPQFQDPASLPALDEAAIAEIREQLANAEPQEREQRLAFLYQLIQQYMVEAGAGTNARMPIPPPLLHSAAGVRAHPGQQVAGGEGAGEEDVNGDDDGKLKRGSYMSLCHFKICNMGRKRNYRYNQWVRV